MKCNGYCGSKDDFRTACLVGTEYDPSISRRKEERDGVVMLLREQEQEALGVGGIFVLDLVVAICVAATLLRQG